MNVVPETAVTAPDLVRTTSARPAATLVFELPVAVTGGTPGAEPVTVMLFVMTVPVGVAGFTRNTIVNVAVAAGLAGPLGRGAKLPLVQVIAPVPSTGGVEQLQPAGALMD